VDVFGVELVGFSAESGRKLLLTVLAVELLWGTVRALEALAARLLRQDRARFWGIGVASTTIEIVGAPPLRLERG